jgi:hypothetical protein
VKKGEKEGVRIMSCLLPKKRPWLNLIEPKWMHGKRRIVEADSRYIVTFPSSTVDTC